MATHHSCLKMSTLVLLLLRVVFEHTTDASKKKWNSCTHNPAGGVQIVSNLNPEPSEDKRKKRSDIKNGIVPVMFWHLRVAYGWLPIQIKPTVWVYCHNMAWYYFWEARNRENTLLRPQGRKDITNNKNNNKNKTKEKRNWVKTFERLLHNRWQSWLISGNQNPHSFENLNFSVPRNESSLTAFTVTTNFLWDSLFCRTVTLVREVTELMQLACLLLKENYSDLKHSVL